MNAHRQFIADAFAAVTIESASSFSWFARPSTHGVHDDTTGWPPQTARALLCQGLELELYANAYCPGTPVPALEPRRSWAPPRAAGFAAALSAANTGTGSWDPGWEVVGRENGRLVIRRDGLSLWIDPSEAKPLTADQSTVSARLPKELCRLSPGFYMALGERGLALDRSAPLVRLYWHVKARCAVVLVRAVTGRLNDAEIAFHFKVAERPDQYARCDAGVLYLSAAEYDVALPAIESVVDDAREWLEPSVPAMTKRLAPGVAVAEDPGNGESFGVSRCRLVADAILSAHERGVTDTTGRLEVAAATFAAAGLDLDRPYLDGAGHDRYQPLDHAGAAS